MEPILFMEAILSDTASTISTVRQYVEMMANAPTLLGFQNANVMTVPKLVLQHGIEMRLPDPPVRIKADQLGNCYQNAYLLALRNPQDLVYCEGWAISSIIPVEHAWVVRRSDGAVIDSTWQRFLTSRKRKVKAEDMQYFGIPLKLRWVTQQIVRNKVYGVLNWMYAPKGILRDDPALWREESYEQA